MFRQQLLPTVYRHSLAIPKQRYIFIRNMSDKLCESSAAYASIQTPPACYADFCLIPVGTGSVSVAAEVAEVQKVLKASGLKYTMHSAGTTVEGCWDDVMAAIGKAHAVVHKRGVVRVQSSMRVGTRTDKKQTAEEKVKRVERLLDNSELDADS